MRIRALVPADLAELHRLVSSDPEVQRYRHMRVAASIAESRPFFERLLEHQRLHGFSLWAVEDRLSGELLGQCGLVRFRGPAEIAYSFGREHWGRGYATEAARACLDFAMGELAIAPVVAFMDPANLGSKRVAEKLGMRFDGRTDHDGIEYLRYVIP
ncbi:MAG TPA: GNAT family N-acetyltransferase [Candidatus Limnocylindria bacterium]|nr:GNAT family N-acetyltransferase [Candidatus Limnocylindria bacterium]